MLPLYALSVTLEIKTEVTLPFFHQPLIRALLYDLLEGQVPDHDGFSGLTFDTPETGRALYKPGSYYRFTLYISCTAVKYLDGLITRIKALPTKNHKPKMQQGLYTHQIQLHKITDLFSNREVQQLDQLSAYGHEQLAQECNFWRKHDQLKLQIVSPMRLKRSKQDCESLKLKNEQRFCRNLQMLPETLFFQRLHDSFTTLMDNDGTDRAKREPWQQVINFEHEQSHLFWADNQYGGKAKPIGGLLGELQISGLSNLTDDKLHMLVLGQYTGMGQQRSSGLGRYRLVTITGEQTVPYTHAAEPLLLTALTTDNLTAAWQTICDNKNQRSEDHEFFDNPELDMDSVDWRFEQLRDSLLQGKYQPAALQGHVIQKPGGGLRALAIPAFWERVLQRAVTQVMAPALEQYYDQDSYGYRFGRSRINAKEQIEQAYQQGYQWVFEADINDFFDTVDWQILAQKLNALYRFSPLVNLLMDWIAAPVVYQDYLVERQQGLPQGSPVSPMLANILLDEFDADLAAAGFKLIRYADDFVVLCKSRKQAEQAAQQVRQELAELGLQLNEDKSGSPEAPSGWLANVWQRKPHLLSDYKATLPKQTPLGDMPDYGSTLIITGNTAVLSNKAQQLQVLQNDEVTQSIPWSTLHAILLIGNHHVSGPAMRTALAQAISIHFADGMGRYQGCLTNNQPAKGSQLWLVQAQQFSLPEQCLSLAKQLVKTRLAHQQETLRQRLTADEFKPCKQQLAALSEQVMQVENLQQLNGVEGAAAKLYFDRFKQRTPEWAEFNGRIRRPPPDPFNALLSLGFTLLYSVQHSLLQLEGLQPWLGFYHQPRGNHAALASDLMEPFRHVVERHALNQITVLGKTAFSQTEANGCRLTEDARRQYLTALWQKLETSVTHQGQKGSYLWHMQQQTQRLIEYLRHGTEFVPYGVR